MPAEIDYTDSAAIKAYLRIAGSGDDTLLAEIAGRASRIIDRHCGRWFYARAETRTYCVAGPHVSDRLLFLDADLLSVGAIVNGDGIAVSLGSIVLNPPNMAPYYSIRLKRASGLAWTSAADGDQPIAVEGVWGYSVEPPAEIVQAALRLAAWLYRQRDTGADVPAAPEGQIVLTTRGAALPPPRLPADVLHLVAPYVRARLLAA